MRVALISLVTAVAASPMGNNLTSPESRSVDNNLMNNLRFYAQHGAAAYCNAEGPSPGSSVACSGGECDDVMRNGATIISTFQGSSTGIAGYVSVDKTRQEIVFAARGSHNVRNFITDLLFTQRDCDFAPGCKVHNGFAESWNEISAAATSAIKEGLKANPGYRLVITGHSLGGAVATLGGAYLRRSGFQSVIYTFGTPRVGNEVFAYFANSQRGGLFRVTHIDDPVPRLPPMIFGYRHSGTEYWLSNGEALQTKYQPAAVEVCRGIENVACNAGTFGFDILAHFHYLTDISDCAPVANKWKRDANPSDEELKQRLTKWSQQDQALGWA
ncbi:lipase precursor [Cordyceps fumosorosea ARSEF 2679]|uniref:Lipase n=1 Tax=Cordyceps fumosorosea (strain ARSEF 2679) TaxID=1081104 RepID=A0A167LDH9_CORFA|nr:lipase precursor [Cordyceps fumosorosea ARSEF 2679]OAA52957.1 lipase precursor [Cordyceps fumosorosea ARSEF 2679]